MVHFHSLRIVAAVMVTVMTSTSGWAQTVRPSQAGSTTGVAVLKFLTPEQPELKLQSGSVPQNSSSQNVRSLTTTRMKNVPAKDTGNKKTEADGTWSEDGKYLIINLNGQQLRLVKTQTQTSSVSTMSAEIIPGGEVSGRLSHQGRPLVNCKVALVALQKNWLGYTQKKSRELLANTDENGVYHLSNVPAGVYMLRWLPAGESSWIRRAEIRPDLRVRAGETTQVKEVRVAMRTIN